MTVAWKRTETRPETDLFPYPSSEGEALEIGNAPHLPQETRWGRLGAGSFPSTAEKMLDVSRLERPKISRGKLIARCPACAELGADRSCEHLFIADEGRGPFGCILYPGDTGHAHRKRIFELVGSARDRQPFQCGRAPVAIRTAPREVYLPTSRRLTISEMTAIADTRGWSTFAGLELLSQRGLLVQSRVFDDGMRWPAWIITDATRRNAQARRIDGQPWTGIGGKKAKSLPGADPSWPIGASEIGARPYVVFCEGAPDFCAALLVSWFEDLPVNQLAPVCMTGAGNAIGADALPLFRGKRIRIAVHDDEAGRSAGFRWATQLQRAGAELVDGFSFHGLTRADSAPVNDLADFATLLNIEGPPDVRVFTSFP